MDNNAKTIPTKEEVRSIFKDTYNLYIKYNNAKTEQEFNNLNKEKSDLYKQYPYQLTKDIVLDLLEIINKEYEYSQL